MLKKYYTCDYVNIQGEVIGNGITYVWFWDSPFTAYVELMESTEAGKEECKTSNFRRVK